jgi:hypothetical protein
VHLVAAAELARDGVQTKAHGLAEEVTELVRLGRRRRQLDCRCGRGLGGRLDGRLGDDGYRRRIEGPLGAIASIGFVESVPAVLIRVACLPARAPAAAFGAARINRIVDDRGQPSPPSTRSLSA